MPDDFTKEEKEILAESPADSPVNIAGDSEQPTSPTGPANTDEESTLPNAQTRQPAEGGRKEADG